MNFYMENKRIIFKKLLEECDREKLDIQEDYWQEFFHAKDFGYSIK